MTEQGSGTAALSRAIGSLLRPTGRRVVESVLRPVGRRMADQARRCRIVAQIRLRRAIGMRRADLLREDVGDLDLLIGPAAWRVVEDLARGTVVTPLRIDLVRVVPSLAPPAPLALFVHAGVDLAAA